VTAPRLTPLALVTVALALVGGALGLAADGTAFAAPLFAAAALAAVGTAPAWLFGALALVAGATTVPSDLGLALGPALVGALLAGVAMGLLGRELDRHLAALVEADRLHLIVLAALALAATLVLPDGPLHLVAPEGGPLSIDALLADPGTGVRLLRPLPAIVDAASPLGDLQPLALVLAGVTAFAAAAMSALGAPVDRILRVVATVTAGLAALVALVAIVDLLVGEVALDPVALAHRWSLEGRAAVLDVAAPESAGLALWSRPMIDGLRLVAALLLLAALRAPLGRRAAPATRVPPLGWLAAALAAALVATAFVAVPMALAGGAVLGCGALVVGRTDPSSTLLVRVALALVLVLWVWGAVAGPPVVTG